MQGFDERVDARNEQNEANEVDENGEGDTSNQFRQGDDGEPGDGDKYASEHVSAPIANPFALHEGGDDVDTTVQNDEEAQDFDDSGGGLAGVEDGVEAEANGDDALDERRPPEAGPRFLYGVNFFWGVWLCRHDFFFISLKTRHD